MKHKLKLKETMHLPVEVEFEVEFDTETGEAEVLGHGNVVASPDHVSRRRIQRIELEEIDRRALVVLLERGLQVPNKGDEIMLHGEPHVLDDYFEEDDNPSAEEFVECLINKNDARPKRRTRKMALRRR
jgi:hypothetical protein